MRVGVLLGITALTPPIQTHSAADRNASTAPSHPLPRGRAGAGSGNRLGPHGGYGIRSWLIRYGVFLPIVEVAPVIVQVVMTSCDTLQGARWRVGGACCDICDWPTTRARNGEDRVVMLLDEPMVGVDHDRAHLYLMTPLARSTITIYR
jgi:hypothetical protein